MVEKNNRTRRDNISRQTINERTILDEDKSNKSIIGWILVALLIVIIVLLTFLFRKDVLIESAKQYVEDNDIEIKEKLIIEAQDLENGDYKTGMDDSCIKESYVIVTKDEDDKIIYESVEICDDIEPTIELIGNKEITMNINSEYKELGAKAELGPRDITDRIVIDTSELDINSVGVYEIEYKVTDRYGNTASATRNVEVIDHIAPEIILYGGYTVSIYQGLAYKEPGYIATDNVDGNITSKVSINGTVNTSVVGSYNLTYSVEDAAENKITVTRRVNVIAIPAPTLKLNGANAIYHTVGTPFKDPGATATDPILGNISNNIVTTGTVDITKLGTYTLTYKVVGTNGTSTITRTVKVVDNVSPIIELIGDKEMTLILGRDTYSEQGANVSDNFDQNPIFNITGTVDDTTVGIYVVTYTSTDASGNKTVITRTVNVREIESIAITTPATKTTYKSGEALDISGLVVTATLDDASTIIVPITIADITGFDSSIPTDSQTLTITYLSKITTYDVVIVIGDQEGIERPNTDDGDDYTAAYDAAGVSATKSGNNITINVANDLSTYTISNLLRREGKPTNTDAYIGIVFSSPNVNATKVIIDIDTTTSWRTVDLTSSVNDNTRLNNLPIIYFQFAEETAGTWAKYDDSHSLVFKWYDSSNNLIATTKSNVTYNFY